ncbi:centrosomal of 41 kDa, partial [Brachionus plicatilis]
PKSHLFNSLFAMSAFSTAKPKKLHPLDKAIKKNPKYDHIESTLDTGSSLTKYMKKIEEIKTNYRYQQDEIFKRMKQNSDLPYLLLDIRDRDEFSQCHIISALSYPIAMLSRSVNNETQEMLAYKNQPGKIIVIYDDDEKLAPRAASTLVQRGYENLFMLSGGLKLAVKKFPQGLVAGEIPAHLLKPDPKANTSRSVLSSVSAMSNFSTASKKTFDRDDIEKLNGYLENEILGPKTNSRYGSRASKDSSRISNVSKADSLASNKTLTSIHEKPWKPV